MSAARRHRNQFQRIFIGQGEVDDKKIEVDVAVSRIASSPLRA